MYYISHCMRVPKAYSRHEQFQNGCVHSCRLYPCSFSLVFLFTDRIPRNHVGASRIAHVCFASPFLFLSLSLPPPLFVAVVLFLREIYTSGGRGWKEDSSLSLEDSTDVGLQARPMQRLSYTAEEMLELERSKFDDKG